MNLKNKNQLIIWTQQSQKVVEKLKKNGCLTVKKEFIQEKYGSEAEIFLKAYNFFVKEAEKIVPRPEGAEYPYWAALKKENALSGAQGYLMKLKIPASKLIIFDRDKWNKILNLSYLPDNKEDLEEHRAYLKKMGITADSEIVLSVHYPQLKRKIEKSWQKLFQDKIENIDQKKAAFWELRSEWLEELQKI